MRTTNTGHYNTGNYNVGMADIRHIIADTCERVSQTVAELSETL